MALDLFTLLGTVKVETNSAERKLSALDGASKESKKSLDDAGDAAEKAGAKIDKAGGRARDAAGRFVAGGRQVEDSARRQFSAVGRLSSKLDDMAGTLTRIGTVMTASITLPILGAAAAVTKAAIDFESSFAGIRKTIDATEKEFDRLELQNRDLSLDIPVDVDDLNKIGEMGGQLGVAKGEVAGFTKTVAQLESTTNLTADAAATMNAQFANIMNNSAGPQYDRLGATLVALGNNGASTERQILEMGLRIAGAGKTIGLTEAQTLGFANALASVGIEAEAGGSAISKTMVDVASAVAKGGKELNLIAGIAGQTAGDFKQAFGRDAAGAIVSFVEGLGKLDGARKFKALEALGFEDVRLRDTLLRAAGAGDLLRKSLDLAGQAWAENTALTAEAEKRYKTTASQLGLTWNAVKDGALTVGKDLLQTLNPFVTSLNSLLIPAVKSLREGWVNLSPAVKLVAVGLLAVAAVAGPVLVAVGAVAAALASMGVAGAVAIGAVVAWGAPLAAMFAAAGAAAYGLYQAFQTNFAGIRDVTLSVWGEVTQTVSRVMTQLVPAVQSALAALRAFWARHGAQIEDLARAAWQAVAGVVSTAVRTVGAVIEFALAAWNGNWRDAWDAFLRILEGAVVGVYNALSKIVKAFALAQVSIFQSAFELGVGIIDHIVAGVESGGPVGRIAAAIISAVNPAIILARSAAQREAAGGGGTAGGAVPRVIGDDGGSASVRLSRDGSLAPAASPTPGAGLRHLSFGGKGGRGGSGESKALRAAKLEMEGLEIVADAAKRIYDRRAADEDFYYSNGLKTLDSFVSMSKTLEGERFAALLKVAEAELRVALKTNATGKVKENLVAKANEKIEALYDEHNQKLTSIDRNAWLARNARERQNWDAKIALLEETASGFASVYQRMADAGTLSFSQAQARAAGAQLEILLAQQKGIQKQLSHTSSGTDAAAALESQLAIQRQKIANFRAQMGLDGADAERRDVQRTLDYASQLRTVYDSIVDAVLDAGEARVRALEQSATSTSAALGAARLRLDFDLKASDLRAARDRAALVGQREYVTVFEQNERQRAAMVEAINGQIVASDAAAAAKRSAVIEEFLNTQRDRLRSVADTIADPLADQIESGFEGGFRGALEGFKRLLDDMNRETLRSEVFKALRAVFNLRTAEESKDGRAGTGPSNPLLKGLAQALGINSLGGQDPAQAAQTQAVAVNTTETTRNTAALQQLSLQVSRAGTFDPQGAPAGLAQLFTRPRTVGAAGQTSLPAAVRAAGEQAVTAVTGAGEAQAGSIDRTGGATTKAVTSSGQAIVSALAGVASVIAAGQGRGSFWKGLLFAAASGAINGALGAAFSGGGDGPQPSDAGIGAPQLPPPDFGTPFPGTPGTLGFAFGGSVSGPGSSTSDSILAQLSNGEYVLRAAAVRRIGVGVLDYMNAAGRLPRFASGGLAASRVAPVAAASVSGRAQGGAPRVERHYHFSPTIRANDAKSVQKSYGQIKRGWKEMIVSTDRELN